MDAVLLALPAPRAASVIEGEDGELARLLRTIPYAGAATANFVFRRAQVRHAIATCRQPNFAPRRTICCASCTVTLDGIQ